MKLRIEVEIEPDPNRTDWRKAVMDRLEDVFRRNRGSSVRFFWDDASLQRHLSEKNVETIVPGAVESIRSAPEVLEAMPAATKPVRTRKKMFRAGK